MQQLLPERLLVAEEPLVGSGGEGEVILRERDSLWLSQEDEQLEEVQHCWSMGQEAPVLLLL